MTSGLVVLALALVLWLVGAGDSASAASGPGLRSAASYVGCLGAVLVLLGLWLSARLRLGVTRSIGLSLAVVVWGIVLLIALQDIVWKPTLAGDAGAETPALDASLPTELLIAALAMIAYSTGVPNLLASDGPRSIVRSWRATRGWFGAQLMVCAVLLLTAWISKAGVVGTYASWMSAIPQWLGRPLLWILFVAPYAHLLLSLRRSLRFYARRGGATRRMA